MFVKIILHVLLLTIIQCKRDDAEKSAIKSPPDYEEYFWVDNKVEPVKRHFAERQHERLDNTNKIVLFDLAYSKNVTYVDEIPHYKLTKKDRGWRKMNIIENEFKNILRMKGLKYVYKRDSHWRTWREIEHNNKSLRVFFYRSVNAIVNNCSDCDSFGFWVIEDKAPPCPYEIFSQPTKDSLCVAHISQFNQTNSTCPTRIPASDIGGTCENPIKTRWRITRLYHRDDVRNYMEFICNGQDFCEIVTLYQINKDEIIFRIVNSTNHIIFSRVMKPNETFSCVEDCGTIHLHTYGVKKSNEPISFNLLNKKKREGKQIPFHSKDYKNTSKITKDVSKEIKKVKHGTKESKKIKTKSKHRKVHPFRKTNIDIEITQKNKTKARLGKRKKQNGKPKVLYERHKRQKFGSRNKTEATRIDIEIIRHKNVESSTSSCNKLVQEMIRTLKPVEDAWEEIDIEDH